MIQFLTGAPISFLGNNFWISLTVIRLFCYCHFVIRPDHGFRYPREPPLFLGWLCARLGRAMQPLNSIDLPDPVGKTPITSWPFRTDSKHFTWKGIKLSDGKIPLLREPTRRSTDKNSGLRAVFDVLFIVCDRMLIYYTHKFWVFGGHVTGRCLGLFPPHLQSQGKAPWGRGCKNWICFVLWSELGYAFQNFLSENGYVSFYDLKYGIDLYRYLHELWFKNWVPKETIWSEIRRQNYSFWCQMVLLTPTYS